MSSICSPAQPLDDTPTSPSPTSPSPSLLPHHPHSSIGAALEGVREAARLNPYVGEPHIVEAQLLLQQGQWVGKSVSQQVSQQVSQ